MVARVLAAEWWKLRTTPAWVPVLAAPLVPALIGAVMRGMHGGGPASGLSWLAVYGAVVQLYAVLFLPLVAGLLAGLCCRPEHLAGGWKQLFALPVTRTAVYAAKFACLLMFLALVQALALLGVWLDGAAVLRVAAPFPWTALVRGAASGWVATVPLAALQLWAATWWKGFAAPFGLNVVCTVPAAAVGSSRTFAPLYPWSQPLLAMLPTAAATFHVSREAAIALGVAGLVFGVGGWLHFAWRDMDG